MTQPEKITLVLRAPAGGTLKPILPFLKLGDQFAAEGFTAVIAGVSDEDLLQVLGQERDERQMQAELWEAAIGAPAHLAAHAQEMHALLRRINVKVGGLNAVLGHGGEPSELMWDEHNEAMDAIWELLAKVQSDASVDNASVNQIALDGENVNQQQNAPQNIPNVAPANWTDKQVLDFCSVALRHVVVEGDLKFSDINDALRYMADKGEPAFLPAFNIDDHVRMVANDRRYRHLRDRQRVEDADSDLLVLRGDTYYTGADLDREIDTALRLEQPMVQEQQP